MALIDYAQKRAERVFVRSQAQVGVFAVPTARDAVLCRGAVELAATATEFVPSEEIRATPDADQLIRRKKPPSEGTLTCYAKVPATPGRLPQWGALARQSFGIEEQVLEVLDQVGLAAASPPVTVTVTIDGVATVLEEGVDWTAATSEAATATSLASALAAVAGLTAEADGATVLLRRADGVGEVTLATSAPAADLRLGETRYRLASDIAESLLTIVHATHNAADWYRDCLVNQIQLTASGGDEATLAFAVILGNSVSVMQTRLAAAIEAVNASSEPRGPSDPVTVVLEDVAVQLGPTAADVVYLQVGDEVLRLDTWDPATKTGTGVGAQLGTTAAAHAIGDEVHPSLPGPDPDPNDQILALTLGECTWDGQAHRIVSAELTVDQRMTARIDEAFAAALTGYRRRLEGRRVEASLVAYQRRAILALTTYSEREQAAPATIRLGRATGPRLLATLPQARLGRVEKGESGGEFTRTFPVLGLASASPGNDGITLTVRAD